jgi:hypothetical protein
VLHLFMPIVTLSACPRLPGKAMLPQGFLHSPTHEPRMLRSGTPPTPIQEQDIPLALAGRGVIGCVQMARNTAKVETERKGE